MVVIDVIDTNFAYCAHAHCTDTGSMIQIHSIHCGVCGDQNVNKLQEKQVLVLNKFY